MTSSLDNVMVDLQEVCELTIEKKHIEARLKELNPLVRPALEDKGIILVQSGKSEYTMELKLIVGRKTFNKKAAAADGVDIEKYEKVGSPYSTLTVKQLEV